MESYDYTRYDMDKDEHHFIDDRHLKNAIADDGSNVQEESPEEELVDGDIYAKIRSLKILANMGDISAIYNLGLIYYEGQGGIAQDFIEAFRWFEKGVEKKDKDCSYMLGFMLENAQGSEINVPKAIELYEAAAAQELIDAKKRLAAIYSLGDYKNDAKAKKYYEDIVAVDGNDLNSKYNLAIMYYSGAGGGGVNYQKAVDLFKDATENKEEFFYANYLIASIYRSGVLGKPDNLEALNWYKKAAELGVACAFFDMASVYYEGKFGAP
jgi:TPR repeat protein